MIGQLWQVAGGDVRVAVDEAEWWGASLSVLIAAVHHPDAFATCQPETDPVEVARDMLADVAELYAAAAVADTQARRADPGNRPASVPVRRDGAEIVFAPGAEVANLARCLELFASAVVDPGGADAPLPPGERPRTPRRHGRLISAGRRGRSAQSTLLASAAPAPSRRPSISAMIAGRRPITERAGERSAPSTRRSRGPGSGAALCDRVALAPPRRPVVWGGGMADPCR